MISRGIELSVQLGPGVPQPLPLEALEALVAVSVRNSSEARNGFQLTFRLDKGGLIETSWLPGYMLEPLVTRVTIEVHVHGARVRLMDGVLTQQEVSPSNDPGQSTLTLTGEDVSVLMDLIDLTGVPYPFMPTYARVMLALGKYAALGLVPAVVPDPRMFMDINESATHRGTDYGYVQKLARDLGYVFYVQFVPGAPSLGYLGPQLGFGLPNHPALTVNMGPHSNVESLSFSFDGLAKQIELVWIHEATTKVSFGFPVPELGRLLRPPLSVKPQTVQKFNQTNVWVDSARPIELIKKLSGKMLNVTDPVTGEGTLDVGRYGHVLQPRALVGVRGAGPAYDGRYFVTRVSHDLRPRQHYKQTFSLEREGRNPPPWDQEVMV